MEFNQELIITIIWMIITIVGFIPLYLDYFDRRKNRWDNLLIKLFTEPGYDDKRINIHNLTDTAIDRCNVWCDDSKLPWLNKDKSYNEIIMASGGAGNVLIPEAIQTKGAHIIIKSGNKTVKKVKYEDIAN